MSVELGFSGSSQQNPSIAYFNITVPTDGSTQKVNSYQASAEDTPVAIPEDFAVSSVQLAAVPTGIQINIHFESKE
ncbi:MAG: hypothetical protein M1822_002051, partial [Bathelium mastoideum]